MKPKGHTTHLELARENGINDICFYKRVERGMQPYLAERSQWLKEQGERNR